MSKRSIEPNSSPGCFFVLYNMSLETNANNDVPCFILWRKTIIYTIVHFIMLQGENFTVMSVRRMNDRMYSDVHAYRDIIRTCIHVCIIYLSNGVTFVCLDGNRFNLRRGPSVREGTARFGQQPKDWHQTVELRRFRYVAARIQFDKLHENSNGAGDSDIFERYLYDRWLLHEVFCFVVRRSK